jgi:ATP-dependent DNA helicase RecQ
VTVEDLVLRVVRAKPTRELRERTVVSVDSPTGDLFLRLKALRKRIADRDGVPAYIVFNDRTLAELAERQPRSLSEMLEVSGVGEAKLEKYGREFLAEITTASSERAP